jgi:hypothetical protein
MRFVAPVFASLACLALAACSSGGSGSVPAPAGASATDVTQIEATAARFAAAVRRKDATSFCRLLSPGEKQRLGGQRRCLVVWGKGRNPLFAAKSPDLKLTEITKLQIPNASARLADGGRVVFLQEGGHWYLNLAPAKK